MAQQTHIYAGVARWTGGTESGLYRRAAGETGWQRMGGGLPDDIAVQAITLDPADPDTVYIGTQDGPWRSRDRGAHWERLAFPERNVQIWSLQFHPQRPRTIYAGAAPVAVYRSDDAGESWQRLGAVGIPDRLACPFPSRVMRIDIDPAEPDTLYASIEVNGVMRSRDGGATWEDCSADLIRLAEQPRLKSKILSDNEIEGMLDGHALCVTGPGTVITAQRMGLFRSTDRGGHWTDMEVGRFSPLTYSRDIRISPHDPSVLYACFSPAARSQAGSLYRSADRGESWARFDVGQQPDSTMMAVALHPRDPDQVYCITRFGQVYGTRDAGRNWELTPLPGGCRDIYALACG